MLAKTKEMKKSHCVPLMIDQQPRGLYDRSRGRQILMRRDESGAEGDEEVVFDQDTFASKLRQNCISSSNPWRSFVQLGKDMRKKGREAPSTDLGDWMEGKVFFGCIVEEKRADDALMSGANEEKEWRAVWRGERDQRSEKGQNYMTYVFGGAAMQ